MAELQARARRKVARLLGRGSSPPGSAPPDAPAPDEPSQERFPEDRWFADHIEAAREVARILDAFGRPLRTLRVADVGTGDGIIAMGLAQEAGPREVVAYDINATDVDHLLSLARANRYAEELPPNLVFERSEPDRIPAEDGTFDAVLSWSCFEHVSEPETMAREMRRVVSDDGIAFVQLWPFYFSEHGSHLFDWYDGGFPHLRLPDERIRARLMDEKPLPHSDYIWNEYQHLNKITVDDLGDALTGAGFHIAQAELISHPTTLPAELEAHSLSRLLVSGIKLVALPR